MTHLYTKTGDKGFTNLYDMRKVAKTDPIFEALGDLDELSSAIGLACVYLSEKKSQNEIVSLSLLKLRRLQSRLLDIGSDIAIFTKREKIVEVNKDDISNLEREIDFYSEQKPPLREFILPGHGLADAQLHLCRTICRRAERSLWGVRNRSETPVATQKETFIYINRLSDFFFALARFVSVEEVTRSQANAKA